MHCPRCGTSSTPGQQFCRACGLGLEKVAELLGEEISVQPATATSARAQLRARQQRFENLAGIAGLTTFGLILLLFMILIFSQMILRGGFLIIPGALLILLAVGAAVMVGFAVYSKSLKARLADQPLLPATEPLSLATPATPPLPPPSVSENTTELLDS